MRSSSFFTYAFFIGFLLFWWAAAFKNTNAFEPENVIIDTEKKALELPVEIASLAKFPDRELLRQALLGDYKLMAELIAKWDIDQELLIEKGFNQVKRLDRALFLKSQKIARLLENEKFQDGQDNPLPVIDDRGFPHVPLSKKGKFLPQTYMAAGILLTLADPEQIVALPKGFKAEQNIYASKKLGSISNEFDRFASEGLALDFPDIAFVSKNYSHPTSIDVLTHLGIEIFYTPEINSFLDIQSSIRSIGTLIGKPYASELLITFIESALNACDNCYKIQKLSKPFEKTIVVNYYTHFSLPGKKSLTYYLLERLAGSNHLESCSADFSQPLSEEELVYYNPEKLIVLGDMNLSLKECLLNKESLQSIDAIHSHKVTFVPEDVQWTPSQFLVLAYYDLAKALCE